MGVSNESMSYTVLEYDWRSRSDHSVGLSFTLLKLGCILGFIGRTQATVKMLCVFPSQFLRQVLVPRTGVVREVQAGEADYGC